MKKFSSSCDRNKDPILKVLQKHLNENYSILEIASGTGQHCSYFGKHLPHVNWQPTDCTQECLVSINSYLKESDLKNVNGPKFLDVCDSSTYLSEKFNSIFCSNMIHISPWEATLGLFKMAANSLLEGGSLILYGPFKFPDKAMVNSNVEFDNSLKLRNSLWGIRDVAEIDNVAKQEGLVRALVYDMPANNNIIVFEKK